MGILLTFHVESSSKDNDSNPDPNMADDPLGGSFFASPSRSTAAPPEGTTSGGCDGGEMVKRVEVFESKLKARGRNVSYSESDKRKMRNRALYFPLVSSIHTDAFVHGNDVPTGTASDFSPDPSKQGWKQAEWLELQEEMERRKRQDGVINSARLNRCLLGQTSWGQVHANQGLTADLLGPDVNEDNFAERMVALNAEREECMALKYVKIFTDDQLKAEFDKIRNAAADLLLFVDSPPSTPAVTPDTFVDPPVSRSSGPRTRSHSSAAGITTYSTRRKSLATRKMSSSEVDLHAPDESFIQVLSGDDSDDSDDDTDPLFFGMHLLHGKLEILHLLDRQDLSKLYGMVVKHYEVNPLAVWNDQQEWVIRSWKLFPFSGVHVLETFTGKILYMFADTPYPLSASLMKKMLKHKLPKLEWLSLALFLKIESGSPEQTALQINTPLDVMENSSINLAAAVFVAVSILKALKTKDLSRKLEVNYVKFQFRGGLLGLKDLSRAETYKWYQSLERVSVEE
ncbi:hypothetical protein Tco_1104022 [Tanacetum coccineum]